MLTAHTGTRGLELTMREDRSDVSDTARRIVMLWAAMATLVAGVFLTLGAWLVAVFEMAVLFLLGQLVWVHRRSRPREERLVVYGGLVMMRGAGSEAEELTCWMPVAETRLVVDKSGSELSLACGERRMALGRGLAAAERRRVVDLLSHHLAVEQIVRPSAWGGTNVSR